MESVVVTGGAAPLIWKTSVAVLATTTLASLAIGSSQANAVTRPVLQYPNGYRGTEVVGRPGGRPALTPASISPSTPHSSMSFTPLAVHATGENDHKLTVKVLDRSGKAPADANVSYVILTALDGSNYINATVTNGVATGQVPAGAYSILTYVTTPGAQKSLTAVYLPDVAISKDTALTLDARLAQRVQITADNAQARPVPEGGVARIDQKIAGTEQEVALFGFSDEPTYVTPAKPAPGLAFRVQARLTRNGTAYGSPYIYNVGVTLPGGIPAHPSVRVITKNMAKEQTTYRSDGKAACAGGHTYADWPGGVEEGLFAGIGALPATRTEYFSPGVQWGEDSAMTTSDCAFTSLDVSDRSERFAHPGSFTRSWFAAPMGPGGDFDSRLPDGTLQLWMPLLSSTTGQSGLAPEGNLAGTETLEDAKGAVIGTGDQPGFSTFTLSSPRSARYKAVIDASRTVPYSDLTVRQHDVWTFTSKKPSGDYSLVPLLEVLYRTPLDTSNQARAGATQTITLLPVNGAAGEPDGTPTRLASLRKITLRISYDDGSTWQSIPVVKTKNGWVAETANPDGLKARFASLRMTAEDTSGRTADQTVIHAYAIRH
jgi:hypothetical protein